MVAGFGDAASYETLARKIAHVEIDKSARFTDWSHRPLSKRQLEYAMADVTHPDHVAESYAQREKLKSGAITHFQIEKRYLHRAGHVFWGLTNVSIVRDGQGRPVQYVGQVQDITQRKAAEESLGRYSQRLQLLHQIDRALIAGTDPADAQSYLKIDTLNAATTGATLTFGTVSNKTYSVQYTDALGSGSWSTLADLAARTNNATETVFDPAFTPTRAYRLVTPRQP